MSETATLERLQEIFRDVLRQPSLVLSRESNAKVVKGWDSLAHVNLIWNVEHDFGVRFALGELQDLKNVGDLIDLLERKIAAKR